MKKLILKMDDELKNLIPPLTPEEYSELEESIKKDGCRDALVVWDNIIIDGHNRYEICNRLGIIFKTANKNLDDRDAAKIWIIKNQLGRRNINAAQRIDLTDKLFGIKEKQEQEKKQHMRKGGLTREKLPESVDKGRSRDKLGKKARVSGKTYEKGIKIKQNNPVLWKDCLDGKKSINEAYAKVNHDLKEQKRNQKRQGNIKKLEDADDPLKSGAKFTTIVIDPPWSWDDEGDVDQLGRAKPTYATLSLDELLELPLPELSDDDCHIYLWITNRSLPKGFQLLKKWGFRYITVLTWPKPSFGMGNYFRGQTEHILFGIKGSLPLKRKDASTLLPQWKRGLQGHSSKPPEFFGFVESCSPGPYLAMFYPGMERKDWFFWGVQHEI